MKISLSSRTDAWNESYKRGENNIQYPQTEVVRFLNRYVVKRLSNTTFSRVMETPDGEITCLDFGCGIGTHTALCDEFGITAYGVDISQEAIKRAKDNASARKRFDLADRFSVLSGERSALPFEDNAFDIAIAESCLDSMHFEYAAFYFNELKRVTRRKVYFSVISPRDSDEEVGDQVVKTAHEEDTIQCYFNIDLILRMTNASLSNFDYLNHHLQENMLIEGSSSGRYYGVLDLDGCI